MFFVKDGRIIEKGLSIFTFLPQIERGFRLLFILLLLLYEVFLEKFNGNWEKLYFLFTFKRERNYRII